MGNSRILAQNPKRNETYVCDMKSGKTLEGTLIDFTPARLELAVSSERGSGGQYLGQGQPYQTVREKDIARLYAV